MKRNCKWLFIFILAMGLILVPAQPTLANSAEPPALVILVTDGPKDLQLSLLEPGKSPEQAIRLDKETKAWESHFTFYFHMLASGRSAGLKGSSLLVSAGGETFAVPIPESADKSYNNLLTLDLAARSLVSGQPAWRVPFLVFLRVALTLLIEGVIFRAFGYRLRSSWILFLAVNLLTQTGLNLMITGPGLAAYWVAALVILESLILVAELILYLLFLKEHGKVRAALFAVTANGASLILGGLLISRLPV